MTIYPVKENTIGSVVSEILQYRHTDTQIHRYTDTDKQTSCYFSIRIIMKVMDVI